MNVKSFSRMSYRTCITESDSAISVMGWLGMLAVQSVVMAKGSRHLRKLVLAGLAGGLLLFVLVGLNPKADVLAHLGGFASGLFIGATLVACGDSIRKPMAGFLCALLFILFVVLPWYLALR